jgi:hypothetical protein
VASNPPLVLVDNLFDRTNLYTAAVLTSSTVAQGRDAAYAADYRRERSFWQPAAAAAYAGITVDIGAGNTRSPDSLWLDRGHNLWGKTVQVVSATDAGITAGLTTTSLTVPAQGTIGGDPTGATMCATEEGALYSLFAAHPARRYFKVQVVENWQPIVTGIILGVRVQLQVYSSKLDEDAGGRVAKSQESDAGYLAVDRVYAYRTIELNLSLISAAEYDATIRYLRRLLFEINQPFVVVMNYGRWPERGWLYQHSPNTWSGAMQRVYRQAMIQARELYPLTH